MRFGHIIKFHQDLDLNQLGLDYKLPYTECPESEILHMEFFHIFALDFKPFNLFCLILE